MLLQALQTTLVKHVAAACDQNLVALPSLCVKCLVRIKFLSALNALPADVLALINHLNKQLLPVFCSPLKHLPAWKAMQLAGKQDCSGSASTFGTTDRPSQEAPREW